MKLEPFPARHEGTRADRLDHRAAQGAEPESRRPRHRVARRKFRRAQGQPGFLLERRRHGSLSRSSTTCRTSGIISIRPRPTKNASAACTPRGAKRPSAACGHPELDRNRPRFRSNRPSCPATTSTTSSISKPRRSTSCAKSRASSSAPPCSSPAARIPSACCASRKRRFARRTFPMPFLNVDTGHHFPELNEFRDRRAKELGAKLIVRKVEDAIAKGIAIPAPGEISRNTACRFPRCSAAIEEFRFDCCHRRRAARRGKGPRQGTLLQLPRQLRPVGPERTSARKSGTSTTPASIPAKTCASSRSPTGPRWTCGNTSSARSSKCRPFISATSANASAAAASGCRSPT